MGPCPRSDGPCSLTCSEHRLSSSEVSQGLEVCLRPIPFHLGSVQMSDNFVVNDEETGNSDSLSLREARRRGRILCGALHK